jgi:KDO2-lipid IV(A) lauroyltransferase
MDFSPVMVWLFNQLARLPLSVLHRLGSIMGWLTYLLSGRYARRLRENLAQALKFMQNGNELSAAEFRKILHANIIEAGKGILELPWVWRRPLDEVVDSVKRCHGWDQFEAAHARGKGVIIATPHFGCFELLSLYIAARQPMTSMYRPPRWRFLDILMHEGRERGQTKLAATDMSGVRQLLKALKRGETIGVLPDQAPGNGEGEWVPFFGRPAYTMTLVGRLVQSSDATVLMCHSKRLPDGQGYELYFSPLTLDANSSIPAQLNAAMEAVISTCPEQYLWSYNRYKVPRGVQPPETTKEQ